MRLRIVLIAATILLALDVARSYYARVAYGHPTEMWQPEPTRYTDIVWPPGSDVGADRPLGWRLYARACIVCHGPDGRGNGPAAPSLIPRPRDFTLRLFKYKSTLRSDPPTDDDLRKVIADGLGASAMPSFKDLLNEQEIGALVEQVKQFAGIGGSQPRAITMPASMSQPNGRAEIDRASADRGRSLYATLGCVGCHGTDGRKGGYLQDAKNYPTPIRDLTAPWTFRGGSTTEAIWMRLTTGLAGSSMPSYADAALPEERRDIANYIKSIARIPPWEAGGVFEGPGRQRDLLRRGEYLVHAEMCGLCHTQIDRTGIYRDDRYLAGGMRVVAYPHAVFVSRNLTSDTETGLGRRTEEQIMEIFRSGRTPERQLNFWGMPWFYPHYFTPDDARAIARYLKSQPAVRNPIPSPVRYGFVETVLGKVRHGLPIAAPIVLTYADGNFARDPNTSARPEQLLILGQQIVLGIAFVSITLLTIGNRRRKGRSIVLVPAIEIAVALIVGAALWIVYELPALSLIPPENIVQGATSGIPSPSTTGQSVEQRALADRGKYLFTIASCAFCHGTDGSGGFKISWRPMGTLWVRNITSDRDTGIGSWSDAAVTRAIRSGIRPDGRVLHWQGMIWDHASNWDEEDIRAIVAYVRTLPPVRQAIPEPRPPAPDDCVTYTFWINASRVPGCGDQQNPTRFLTSGLLLRAKK